MSMKLWYYDWEFNYGRLSGVFKATEEQIKSMYNKTLWFGKHSELEVFIEEDSFWELEVGEEYFNDFPEFGLNIYEWFLDSIEDEDEE